MSDNANFRRHETLIEYKVLDTPEESDFDELAILAATVCQTPIALISIIDDDRQWFKSHIGLEIRETPIDQSFCAYAIQNPKEMMIVNDPKEDERFKNNPAVTGSLGVAFYAGVPLVNEDGFALGTLCVVDHKNRSLTKEQEHSLTIIARQVMQKLELKRKIEQLRSFNQQLELLRINQHKLNREIKANNSLARLAVKAAELAIWRFDSDKSELYLSGHYREVFGYEPDEIVKLEDMYETIHPEFQSEFREKFENAVDTRQSFTFEFPVLHHSKQSKVWVQASGAPMEEDTVHRSDDQKFSYIVVMQDITAKKEQIETLSNIVEARTEQLKESDKNLIQFSHVASHDLKEPVRKVNTFLEMIIHDAGSRLSNTSQQYLGKIKKSLDRMRNMLDAAFSFSSPTTDLDDFDLVNVNEIFSEILSDLDFQIQRKKAVVNVGEIPSIRGIRPQLYQLFLNLISNSLKFSKENVPPVIEITGVQSFRDDRSWVDITVKDNGIGFKPEYAERVFDAFTRLNSKDRYEGAGIGLALVRKIALSHFGHIQAKGQPGAGATFIVSFPAVS